MSETYNGCDTGEYIAVPGPRGPQGQQGVQGEPGPTGPQGPQGIAGPMGPAGCQGPKGDRGPAGPQGPQGEQGIPGLNGRDGARGPEGPRGCNGASGKVAFEKLRPEQIEMLRGPRGEQGPRGPQGIRGYNGSPGMQGPTGLTGPQGPMGATGPRGEKGEVGPMGPTGPMGATGPKGDDGATTTVPHITPDGVWSSKETSDYVLHGKVDWTRKTVSWAEVDASHKVIDTANGYAKNVKVYGQTMVNYSTLTQRFEEEVNLKSYAEIETKRIPLFNKAENGERPLLGGVYTVVYTMDNVKAFDNSAPMSWAFNAKIHISVTGGSTIVETLEATNGVLKKVFTVQDLKTIDKIEIQPVVRLESSLPEGFDKVGVSFNVKDFMLLKADYTHKIPPSYFYGTRGVGTTTNQKPATYNINIQSRNKNLINKAEVITDHYLTLPEGAHRAKWATTEKPKSVASFLIYCKPEKDYVFSGNVVDSPKSRLFVAEFIDDPHNGEDAVATHRVLDRVDPGKISFTFRTSSHTNYIALYLANWNETGSHNVGTVFDEIQLEEGVEKTPYEPYRETTKTINISKQLKQNEYLYWDKIKNRYFIHNADGTETDTKITDEELIHTYEGVTYVYVKSKIPSRIDADYPINAHSYYYRKEQTYNRDEIRKVVDTSVKTYTYEKNKLFTKDEFIFNDVSETEDLNFLRLPSKSGNAFILQWKEISFTQGPNHGTQVTFPTLSSLLSVQVTILNQQGQQLSADQFTWMCPVVEFVQNQPVPTIKITANAPQGKTIKGMVWVIGRGSSPTQE